MESIIVTENADTSEAAPSAAGPRNPGAAVMNIDEARERIAVLEAALDDLWRDAVRCPDTEVCKHLVASMILGRMTSLGFEVPTALHDAVVRADDAAALATPRLKMIRSPPALTVVPKET